MPENSKTPIAAGPGITELLAAETTLQALNKQMHAEYEASDNKWPRDWMQKHVNERAIIIKARNILLDRAEASSVKIKTQDP